MLNLRFLGGLAVEKDLQAQPDIKSQKTLGLICYLVMTNMAHNRTFLAGLLWPEMPEANARANLRKVVGQLRALDPYFIISREKIAFNYSEPHWCDVCEFETKLRGKQDIQQLETAVGLFQGDFLEGFYITDASAFEQWMLAQRTRLREEMLQALAVLIAHFSLHGNYKPAIGYARRLLDIEPWREDAHRDLMRCLALDGRRGAALAQFDLCRQLLWEELAVEPAAETQRLYEAISADQLEPVVKTGSSSAMPLVQEETNFEMLVGMAGSPPFFNETATAAAQSGPFVAREDELDRLTTFLTKAQDGQGNLVFISGEAGTGKTSLVEAFASKAQAFVPGLAWVQGVCNVYTGVGEPYLPFRSIMSMLLGDVNSLWSAGVISQQQAQRLWDLIPLTAKLMVEQCPSLIDVFVPRRLLEQQVAAYAAAQPEQVAAMKGLYAQIRQLPPRSTANQDRLFEETAVLLAALADDQPLMLILDDLHWADLSSVSLLSFLSRRLAHQPILIIGLYRPEDLALGYEGQVHPLQNVLNEWRRQAGEIVINLDRADPGQAFIDALIDSSPNQLRPSFRRQLSNLTAGHPLFTVEMLRDLEEQHILHRDAQGRLVQAAVAWETMPARVEGVIARRIERLGDELQEALVIGCVQGERFTAEITARVLGLPVPILIRRLSQELDRKHRLVRALGAGTVAGQRRSTYQFRHNLFQAYLYNRLDDIERIYYHETIGQALEAMYGVEVEQVAVELSRHFAQAGRSEKAVHYLTLAGDAALDVYAYAEAILQFQQALDLLDPLQTGSGVVTAVYSKLGRALELDSQFVEAIQVYDQLKGLGQQRGDQAMELVALSKRMTLQSFPSVVQDLQAAISTGDQALDLARLLDDRKAEAKIEGILAVAYGYANQVGPALEAGQRSLDLARQIGDQEQLAQTLHDVGTLYYLFGRLTRSIDLLNEANDLWRAMDNQPMLADALSSVCVCYVTTGQFDRADAQSEAAKFISESINNTWGLSYSQWVIGTAHWERGLGGKAIESMRMAIDLGEKANFIPAQTKINSDLGFVYGELGDLTKGFQHARRALAIAEANDFRPDRPRLVGHLALLHIHAGELDQAQELINKAKNNLNLDLLFFGISFLIAETELALRQGAANYAQPLVKEMLGQIYDFDFWLFAPEVLYQQGRLRLLCGQADEARQSFQEARKAAQKIGSQRMMWRILYNLSMLAADGQEAKRLSRQAQQVVEFIAQHTGTDYLKRSFLSRPAVKLVLEAG